MSTGHGAAARSRARSLDLRKWARARAPELGLAALTLVLFALNVWWLGADTRPLETDSGGHQGLVEQYHQLIKDGHPKLLFERWDTYTPLVHISGALAAFVVGTSADAQIIAYNLIFLPLLALGVYGAGTAAYGRRAGVLAGVFILAAPLIIYSFRVYMLDVALTAMTAMVIWLLIASRRFERRWYVVAAGVFVGLGLMTKNTFPAFVAGLILIMLIRGGWREWRNLLFFGGAAAVVAGPWYIHHWSSIVAEAKSRSGTGHVHDWYGEVPYPERWELGNYTWYGWNLVNNQLYMPLTVFFAIGLVLAGIALYRRRIGRSDYTPELLAGGFVGYLVMTQSSVDDPRYNLPCLVYVAVLGTAWIVRLRRPWQTVAAATLAGVFALNAATATFGLGDRVRIKLPGAIEDPNYTRQLVLLNGEGYASLAEPDREARVADVFRAAYRDGVRRMGFGGEETNFWTYQGVGSGPMREAGITWGADLGQLHAGDMYVYRRPVEPGDPPPCTWVEGQGIYLVRADPAAAGQAYFHYPLYCPTRPYTRNHRPH